MVRKVDLSEKGTTSCNHNVPPWAFIHRRYSIPFCKVRNLLCTKYALVSRPSAHDWLARRGSAFCSKTRITGKSCGSRRYACLTSSSFDITSGSSPIGCGAPRDSVLSSAMGSSLTTVRQSCGTSTVGDSSRNPHCLQSV
jgi:hypothetical protein